MSEFNVLISSAGRRVALMDIFRAALVQLDLPGRVVAGELSPCAAAFHHADEGFLVPRCTAPEFVPHMLKLCEEQQIRLIVPTIDTELPVFAAARERFAAIGTTVAVSSPLAVDVGRDKLVTHQWLTENALPTVQQMTVEQALASIDELELPVLVKPVAGSSSIGVARVYSAEELRVATRSGGFIVQAIAPGVEYTVDGYVDRCGRCVSVVPRRRLEVRAGEVSKAAAVKSAPVMDVARRVFEALDGAYGVLNVQIFMDEQQTINIIEINARFGGGYPLSWQAGARYPVWMIEDISGLESTATDQWRDGLVMLRYDDAVFVAASEAGL